jgi:hypothetical protein
MTVRFFGGYDFVPRDATQETATTAQPLADDALTARTNGFGEYTLASLPMGAYRARIVHPARAMTFVADLDVREAQARFDVDLPLATITGRVIDAAGNAVAGARVRVELGTPGDGPLPAAEDPAARFVTAADGMFELRGVQTNVDLAVSVDDGAHQPARSGIVRVGLGETRSGVDFVLTDGATLAVSLFATDGDPVRGCRVRAAAGTLAREATSDGTGIARFFGLAPGTWRIAVDAPARYGVLDGEPTVEVKPGLDNSLRIDLR